MKTIPTKNGELLCVEVPMDAHSPMLISGSLQLMVDGEFGVRIIDIATPEDVLILGFCENGVLDFDAEPYVETRQWDELVYLDYTYEQQEGDISFHRSASASFLSLLTSHNVEYSGKKIVILSKK